MKGLSLKIKNKNKKARCAMQMFTVGQLKAMVEHAVKTGMRLVNPEALPNELCRHIRKNGRCCKPHMGKCQYNEKGCLGFECRDLDAESKKRKRTARRKAQGTLKLSALALFALMAHGGVALAETVQVSDGAQVIGYRVPDRSPIVTGVYRVIGGFGGRAVADDFSEVRIATTKTLPNGVYIANDIPNNGTANGMYIPAPQVVSVSSPNPPVVVPPSGRNADGVYVEYRAPETVIYNPETFNPNIPIHRRVGMSYDVWVDGHYQMLEDGSKIWIKGHEERRYL